MSAVGGWAGERLETRVWRQGQRAPAVSSSPTQGSADGYVAGAHGGGGGGNVDRVTSGGVPGRRARESRALLSWLGQCERIGLRRLARHWGIGGVDQVAQPVQQIDKDLVDGLDG